MNCVIYTKKVNLQDFLDVLPIQKEKNVSENIPEPKISLNIGELIAIYVTS
jgi:hypothetical protein